MSINQVYAQEEELVIEPPTEFNRMELGEEDWMSIYIPVLPDGLLLQNHYDTVQKFYPKYLHGFIEKILRIGKIRRIDFIDRQIQASSMPVKAAFVHFEYWYDTKTARNLREKLNSYGQYRQKGYVHQGKRCNFYAVKDGNNFLTPAYFDVRINHTPIQEADSDRNVHQLYAENLALESDLNQANHAIVELQCQLNKALFQLDEAAENELRSSCNHNCTLSLSKPRLERSDTYYYEQDSGPPLTMEDLAC